MNEMSSKEVEFADIYVTSHPQERRLGFESRRGDLLYRVFISFSQNTGMVYLEGRLRSRLYPFSSLYAITKFDTIRHMQLEGRHYIT
jgi:hypothetical protein